MLFPSPRGGIAGLFPGIVTATGFDATEGGRRPSVCVIMLRMII